MSDIKNNQYDAGLETESQDENNFWAISYIDLLMILLTLFVLLLAYSKFPSQLSAQDSAISEKIDGNEESMESSEHTFSIGPVYTNRNSELEKATNSVVEFSSATQQVHIVRVKEKNPRQSLAVGHSLALTKTASQDQLQSNSIVNTPVISNSEFGSWLGESFVATASITLESVDQNMTDTEESQLLKKSIPYDEEQDNTASREDWFKIGEEILFDSGSAALSALGKGSVDGILPLIEGGRDQVIIEGHTDDVPISNGVFPSNWSLATARAAVVGERLISAGIEPGRIKIIGYGATKPQVEDYALRKLNRRVAVYVSPGS